MLTVDVVGVYFLHLCSTVIHKHTQTTFNSEEMFPVVAWLCCCSINSNTTATTFSLFHLHCFIITPQFLFPVIRARKMPLTYLPLVHQHFRANTGSRLRIKIRTTNLRKDQTDHWDIQHRHLGLSRYVTYI